MRMRKGDTLVVKRDELDGEPGWIFARKGSDAGRIPRANLPGGERHADARAASPYRRPHLRQRNMRDLCISFAPRETDWHTFSDVKVTLADRPNAEKKGGAC